MQGYVNETRRQYYTPDQEFRLKRVIAESAPIIATVMTKLPAGTCGHGLITYSYQLDGLTVTIDPQGEWSKNFRQPVEDLFISAFTHYKWSPFKVMVGHGRSVRFIHPDECLASDLLMD